MRRIILCFAGVLLSVFSAQAAPSDISKKPSANAVSRGQEPTSGIFGPDFWEVTGVSAGDALNMRSAPSPRSPLVLRFQNGATLRNLGCKIIHGGRWCRVERLGEPTARGWVNGRYLREGARQN